MADTGWSRKWTNWQHSPCRPFSTTNSSNKSYSLHKACCLKNSPCSWLVCACHSCQCTWKQVRNQWDTLFLYLLDPWQHYLVWDRCVSALIGGELVSVTPNKNDELKDGLYLPVNCTLCTQVAHLFYYRVFSFATPLNLDPTFASISRFSPYWKRRSKSWGNLVFFS